MSDSPIAALFDMDGVIVDNMPYHIDSWHQFAVRHQTTFTAQEYATQMNGRVAKDILEYLFKKPLQPAEIDRLTEEKEAIYREIYRPFLQPTAGLPAFLEDLRAHGVRMAVGTSAPVGNVTFTLDGLDLRRFFRTVVDASMVSRGKPNPEIYLKAAEQVGVSPARAVVFEDALLGIEAGLRAGMKVVAITTTHSADELAGTGAHRIISSFHEIGYQSLIGLIDESTVEKL